MTTIKSSSLVQIFILFPPSSWVVLRSQLKDPSYEISRKKEVTKLSPVAEPKDKLTTAREWCEDVDDWGDGLANGAGEDGWGDGSSEEGRNSPPNFCSPRDVSEADNECNKVEHLMKAMTVADTSNGTAPIEHVILPSYLGPCYPAGYVCVVEEPDSADTVEVQKLLKKYKNNYPNCDFTVAPEGEGGKESKHRKSGQREKSSRHGDHINGGEAYEKGVARHGDKTFQKFHKQLSKFPQQILRYSFTYNICVVRCHYQILLAGTRGRETPCCLAVTRLMHHQKTLN